MELISSFSALMWVHVVTGLIAVVSGFIALSVRKGAKNHKRFGTAFFISMLFMAIFGAVIAYQRPMMISVIAGLFTCYLVATAWATVKTPAGRISNFDRLSPFLAALVAAMGYYYGMEAVNSESGLKDGFSAEPYFFFAALATVASALDLRQLFYGGTKGAHRLARHLWRMCFAFYIAVGSLFSQGVKIFPEAIQQSPLIGIPENLVALALIFWLVRVFVSKRYNPR